MPSEDFQFLPWGQAGIHDLREVLREADGGPEEQLGADWNP